MKNLPEKGDFVKCIKDVILSSSENIAIVSEKSYQLINNSSIINEQGNIHNICVGESWFDEHFIPVITLSKHEADLLVQNEATKPRTLKERIEECKTTAAEIVAKYPGVTNVSFDLKECDINEIMEFDKNPRPVGNVLRGLVNSYRCNCTIWADTIPFKSVKPLEYEF